MALCPPPPYNAPSGMLLHEVGMLGAGVTHRGQLYRNDLMLVFWMPELQQCPCLHQGQV
jgi:hypothetical protein